MKFFGVDYQDFEIDFLDFGFTFGFDFSVFLHNPSLLDVMSSLLS